MASGPEIATKPDKRGEKRMGMDGSSLVGSSSVPDVDKFGEQRRKQLRTLASAMRRAKADNEEPNLALVLGAGVSLGAGVPTGRGWVPLLWRIWCGQPVTPNHIKAVLDAQHAGITSSAAYGQDFGPYAEEARSSIDEYREDWLKRHPEYYVEEYTCLMSEMSPADQRKAIAKILDACQPLKITWPYLRIAQLVKAKYVDIVLTTNLDIVLIQALSLFNEFPAVCDYHQAAELRSSHSGGPQIIYLHGNRNSYNMRNTGAALIDYAMPMQQLVRGIIQDRNLLVTGYGGWNDGLMALLRERYAQTSGSIAPNNLYWAYYGEVPRDPVLGRHPQIRHLELADCDTLFEELASFLTLPPPLLIENPLGHFLTLLRTIDKDASQSKAYNLEMLISEIEKFSAQLRSGPGPFQIVTAAQSGDIPRAKALVREWLEGSGGGAG